MYTDIVANVKSQLESGLTGPQALVNVLDYEPPAVAATPMAYIFLGGWERNQTGQVVTMRYTLIIRLVLLWQDNYEAERALIPYVNALPNALESDMTLGGGPDGRRVSQVRTGLAEYREIGGTVYRTMDTTISVLEKGGAGTGL